MAKMRAILWDGVKQIKGNLEVNDHHLHFVMEDFKSTNLELKLPFKSIHQVKLHRIFDLSVSAIDITSEGEKHNVFVMESIEELERMMGEIQNKCANHLN